MRRGDLPRERPTHGQLTRGAALNSHIVSIISKLQAAENEMDRRVRRLESHVESRVQAVVTESETRSRAWVMPFLGLVAVMAAGGFFAFRKYRHLLKTHLP